MKRSYKGGATGYTLTELLVVIGIVALLCAILFPVFTKAKETARISECLSNMRQIGNGFHMYTQEFNNRFPAAVSAGSPAYWAARGEMTIQQALTKYVPKSTSTEVVGGRVVYRSAGVFKCPSDNGPLTSQVRDGILAGMPVWKSTGCSYEYYAPNQDDWMHQAVTVPWTSLAPMVASVGGKKARVGATVSSVISPSRKAVIGDYAYWHYGDRTTDNRLAFCNTLFADGHAARVRGADHLEARLERLKPWHAMTELKSD